MFTRLSLKTVLYLYWKRDARTWLLLSIVTGQVILTNAEKSNTLHHVRYYEPVYYDHLKLHRQHHMNKRSLAGQLTFEFEAFGRFFKPRLKRDASAIHPDIVVETSHNPVTYDVARLYTGSIEGYPSRVHGIVTSSGQFEGRIVIGNETFFLEKSNHHFTDQHDFHSIIYRLSDVAFNTSERTCGVGKMYNLMKEDSGDYKSDVSDNFHENGSTHYLDIRHKYQNKYSKEVSDSDRNKRAVDPLKVTCELYMQADHLYYERYYSDVDTVIEKLTQHVQAINNIFTAVDFDQDGSPDNINFIIKKIKVHTDPTVQDYKYEGNLGVETFLDLHSTDNYDDYCLSYLFTNRDFTGGILGLAWVGDTASAGGVCEINREFHGGAKSLNTGVVTIVNYKQEVPSAVSHVTFAHEVGHNFGSPHDPDGSAECTPGGDNGNYIMYAYATSGDQTNNNMFSSCSVKSIGPVLEVKARGTDGCFVANTGAICGNRVKEVGEECDCGWDTECTEGCCNPQTDTPGAETPCTRKSTAVCSPSEGACCTSSCQFRLAAEGYSCRSPTSCLDEAFCDGANYDAACPPSVAKPNATACGDSQDFLVCYKGECSGSVCIAHGRVPCQCLPTTSGDWKDETLCQVCCIDDVGDCRSSYELDDVPDASVVAGTPCYNYGGYCDAYKKCRSVDPSGPLSNLKKLFLDGELINTVKQFLTKHWYVGLAAGLGFIIIIGLVVKFCRKTHKPMDLPDSAPSTTASSAGRNQVRPERF